MNEEPKQRCAGNCKKEKALHPNNFSYWTTGKGERRYNKVCRRCRGTSAVKHYDFNWEDRTARYFFGMPPTQDPDTVAADRMQAALARGTP